MHFQNEGIAEIWRKLGVSGIEVALTISIDRLWKTPRSHPEIGVVVGTTAVFVKGVVRCLSGGVSDFAVAGVALGVEADLADGRPVSDLS